MLQFLASSTAHGHMCYLHLMVPPLTCTSPLPITSPHLIPSSPPLLSSHHLTPPALTSSCPHPLLPHPSHPLLPALWAHTDVLFVDFVAVPRLLNFPFFTFDLWCLHTASTFHHLPAIVQGMWHTACRSCDIHMYNLQVTWHTVQCICTVCRYRAQVMNIKSWYKESPHVVTSTPCSNLHMHMHMHMHMYITSV